MIGPKDIVPTVIAAGSGYLGYLAIRGQAFPWSLSERWVIGLLLIFGIIACATGSDTKATKGALITLLGALGAVSLLLALIGLIWPSAALIIALAGTVVALWLVTTLRHLTTKNTNGLS